MGVGVNNATAADWKRSIWTSKTGVFDPSIPGWCCCGKLLTEESLVVAAFIEEEGGSSKKKKKKIWRTLEPKTDVQRTKLLYFPV